MVHRRTGRRQSSWVHQQSLPFYKFGTRLMGLLIGLWSGRIRGFGMHHVPRDHGVFIIANHTSAIDPFVLTISMGESVPLRGPGKRELFKNRLASFLLRKVGIFPLERDGLDPTSVRTMLELYRAGSIIELYPEGGRSPTGELRRFDRGFTRFILKLRAPLVPVGIAGANEFLPMHTLIPRRVKPMVAVFGQEFDLSEFYGPKPSDETIERATAVLEDQVRTMVKQARAIRAGALPPQ